jgi:hypothetical protein
VWIFPKTAPGVGENFWSCVVLQRIFLNMKWGMGSTFICGLIIGILLVLWWRNMVTELCMMLKAGWMLGWRRFLEMEIGAGNLLVLTILWKSKVGFLKSGLVFLINLFGLFPEVDLTLVLTLGISWDRRRLLWSGGLLFGLSLPFRSRLFFFGSLSEID